MVVNAKSKKNNWEQKKLFDTHGVNPIIFFTLNKSFCTINIKSYNIFDQKCWTVALKYNFFKVADWAFKDLAYTGPRELL